MYNVKCTCGGRTTIIITTIIMIVNITFESFNCLIVSQKLSDYRVGSKGSKWSQIFHFRTLPTGDKWYPRFAIYGDMGIENEVSLPFILADVEMNMYDVIFHVGDFAYNLYEVIVSLLNRIENLYKLYKCNKLIKFYYRERPNRAVTLCGRSKRYRPGYPI